MITLRDEEKVDALIIGSGPIGCTFARYLVADGRKVLMIDAGAQLSPLPGENLKNAFVYQRNIDRFTFVIQGNLNLLSVATGGLYTPTLDPSAFRASGTVRNGQNPRQDPAKNLPAAAATYAVGGMFTHWTCNTPRYHPTLEQIPFIPAEEWDRLYGEAERVFNVRTDVFIHSLRHKAVKRALAEHYGDRIPKDYPVQELPVAGVRRKDNDEFVRWTGSDTVLQPLVDDPNVYPSGRFRIAAQHRAKRLVHSGDKVQHAEIDDLIHWRRIKVQADLFIVCCGSILTPQLLWNSHIRPAALGRYLTEHPMAFTQIVLNDKIVRAIGEEAMRLGQTAERVDPVPIPMHDPPPMVWIPASEPRPWHCQIHRDSFSYGALPPDVDGRLVVDLRWFCMVEPNRDNRVTFEPDINDQFGMPQSRFEFALSEGDRERCHAMMADMCESAMVLGGILPGSEPQFMQPGLALHFMGTYRMGTIDDGTSVTNPHSKVWGFDNLYLGGNGLIPTSTAGNPTLTSCALAIRAVQQVLG
jgi:pyranose oxidase